MSPKPISIEAIGLLFKRFFNVFIIVAVFGLLAKGSLELKKFSNRTDDARKEAICPSLLSISRSARDTLIVMKAEPLCNSFVLDNLK